MSMTHFLALLLTFSVSHAALTASGGAEISVGKAKTRKSVIAFPTIKPGLNSQVYSGTIYETIQSDLLFTDLFSFLKPAAFTENSNTAGITAGTFQMSDWTAVGAEVLVKSALEVTPTGLSYEVHAYQPAQAKEIFAKRYVGTTQEAKLIAHTAANDIVEAFTGLPGIFLTKLLMACERGGKKEIYSMNFDGSEVRQLTNHHGLAFSPAWSPDGKKMAYSLYVKGRDNVKNINLFLYDFSTRSLKLLSNRKGMNSGAAFSPDGSTIALTMSFLGDPDLFTLNPNDGNVTRLTKSVGVDVDPTWSPDGKQLAFVSSRSGKSMIWKASADGSNAQRLTYAGDFNATPTWSPKNNKISFAGWIGGKFDIFIMNPDGTNIERLTNQGNNEDPNFSPDGQFLVFSSNRTGQANIYVMNLDGSNVRRLTYGLGNCVAPRWSGPAKKPITF